MPTLILLVRCERDQTEFEVTPRPSLVPEKPDEMTIDCPTCGRGYYGDVPGGFWSDRELTILARAVVDPFKSNVKLAEEQP